MAHGPGPLLLLLSLLFGAASDRIKVVTVHPGDNVTLNCTAPDHSIIAVVWTRSDLEPEYVLYYSDEHLDPTKQHPSFKDRVDLVDRDLKDGDVSLILKNVSSNDNGTYECRVASKRTDLDSEPITIIRLQVTDSDSNRKNKMKDVPEDGNSSPLGQYGGLAAVVRVGMLLIAVVAVVGVPIYRRRRDNRPEPPPTRESIPLQSPRPRV